MRIEHLEYLICLARTHSITKASEELFTTHQNVSKMIRQLEQELGVTLFTRSCLPPAILASGSIFAKPNLSMPSSRLLCTNSLWLWRLSWMIPISASFTSPT